MNIIQAPMAGGATTPELVAAVSNAGGLGSLAAGYLSADDIRMTIKRIRELTVNPFCVNLFVPQKHHASNQEMEAARQVIQEACHELNFHIDPVNPPYTPSFDEQIRVILDEGVPIFSFTFGIPQQHWIDDLKANGTRIFGTATSLEEAIALENHAVDAVIIQGSEAGGHRGTFIGKEEDVLMSIWQLIPLIAKHVNTPIIAAGGIMDAQSIFKAIVAGASGVQMGTAFLCCPESGIHPIYMQSLMNTTTDTTVLTKAFSGKLARGLDNQFITRMKLHEEHILDYPIQNALTTMMRKEAARQHNHQFMSMWAGQGVQLCKAMPASELIHMLYNELLLLLNNSL